MTEAEHILTVLSGLRIPPQPEEYEIHRMIADALTRADLDFIHECRLLPGRRIDFLCGRTGVEVKKGRPDSAVLQQQLQKYLECDRLDSVIVVLQRPCRLPAQIADKPVYTLALNRLWGVALP